MQGSRGSGGAPIPGGIGGPGGRSAQLSFSARRAPLLSRSSSVGSASGSGTPELPRLGPRPRMRTLALFPVPRINPATRTLSAVPTNARVLMLASCELSEPRSYTSTNPTPVPLLLPRTIAVYAPGSKVVQIADSNTSRQNSGMQTFPQLPSAQLSLIIVSNPGGPCNSRTGSANGLGTPNWLNDGPIARNRTCLGPVPLMMTPPIPT